MTFNNREQIIDYSLYIHAINIKSVAPYPSWPAYIDANNYLPSEIESFPTFFPPWCSRCCTKEEKS